MGYSRWTSQGLSGRKAGDLKEDTMDTKTKHLIPPLGTIKMRLLQTSSLQIDRKPEVAVARKKQTSTKESSESFCHPQDTDT